MFRTVRNFEVEDVSDKSIREEVKVFAGGRVPGESVKFFRVYTNYG